MKILNLNSRRAGRAIGIVAVGLLMGAQTAIACTVGNWTGNSGNVTAGGPNLGGIERYAGVCAMETPAGAVAWVQDDSPGGIGRIRARFYVLNGLTSAGTVVYRGFSATNGTGPRFSVFMNPAGLVTLVDGATGVQIQQSASDPWVLIEIDWSQGSGDGFISLSVDGQTAVEQTGLSNAGSALQSVRLGNLGGAPGTLNFDAYESRRTTAIGGLCAGDAFVDGTRDFADINEIFVEFATGGSNPADGTPDITGDGFVDFADINEVFVLFATGQGACPNA